MPATPPTHKGGKSEVSNTHFTAGQVVAVFTRDDAREAVEAAAGHAVPAQLADVIDMRTRLVIK